MSDSPQPSKTARPRWTAGAIAVLVIGLLILIPSGLCTGLLGIGELVSGTNTAVSNLFEDLLYGGPLILLGALLVYGAFRMRRKP